MLSAYPLVIDIAVAWGDMDSLAHVNNAVFLRYFETARVAYLERVGMDFTDLASGQHGAILGAISCRFRAPVTYPDTLSVGVRVASLGKDRMVVEHVGVSRKLGKIAVEGDALVVCYNYVAGRSTPIPADVHAAIMALEGREPPPLPPRTRDRRSS